MKSKALLMCIWLLLRRKAGFAIENKPILTYCMTKSQTLMKIAYLLD